MNFKSFDEVPTCSICSIAFTYLGKTSFEGTRHGDGATGYVVKLIS